MPRERGASPRARRRVLAATIGWAVLVLALTLRPGEPSPYALGSLCVICGSRGLADALLNLGFFVPLGLGVAYLRGGWAAVGAAFLLSGTVELGQLGLPGRYPTLGDLVWNTAGGGLGALLLRPLRAAPAFLADPRGRGRSALWAVSVAALLGPALLFAPRFPDTVYWGQHTPALGPMEVYRGRVLEARIGEVPVPPGRREESPVIRRALEEGEDVFVRFVTGPPTGGLAPLFSIFDGDERQILFIGVDGTAAFYARRSLGLALRLDHPGLAWREVLTAPVGDTVALRVVRNPRGVCLVVDGAERCGAGLGVRDGWRLLMSPPATELSPGLGALLGFLWVAAVVAPAGAAARGPAGALGSGLLLGVAGVAAAWVVPELLPHVTTPLAAVVGALGGRAVGRGVGSLGG